METVKELDAVQNHPYIIFAMLMIIVVFIIYGIMYYYRSSYKSGHSYYGAAMLDYQPLFVLNNIENIDICKERCDSDPNCGGITYNTATQECIGTSINDNGQLRAESAELTSWVKSKEHPATVASNNYTVLLARCEGPQQIAASRVFAPYSPQACALSFTICITDWHHNYGKWKHVMHKGTSTLQSPILYATWEDIMQNMPQQFIGVWLAPYNATMRIVLNTLGTQDRRNELRNIYEHPNIQVCTETNGCFISDSDDAQPSQHQGQLSDLSTAISHHLEYIDYDITNIPLNRESTYIIAVNGQGLELHHNGRLKKTALIAGQLEFNNSALYVMNEHSFAGYMTNLIYYPAGLQK